MLARFVQSAETLVRQLDSAAAISACRWPLVDRLRVLELQAIDVQASAAGCGRDGVDVYRLTAQALEQLERIVQAHDAGDLPPWRTARPEVCGILAQLRELLVEPQLDLEVAIRAAPVAPPRPATTSSTPGPAQSNVDGGRKGKKADKPPRRRRPGSGKPNGRPSKDADELLERVIREVADEALRGDLNVERELHDRIFSRTSEELCELILQRLRKQIAPSTLRSSSKLWKRWATIRVANGNSAAGAGVDVAIEPGAIHVGGAKRTSAERRQDAEIARWAAAAGVSLDDD